MKDGFKETKIGQVPEEWEISELGDVTDIYVAKDLIKDNFSISKNDDYKYPIFSNATSNKGLYGYYNKAQYDGDSITIVGRGELGVAFTRTGKYGAIGRLIILFPHENVNTIFMTNYINNRIHFFIESSAVPQLTGVQVSKYKVAIPPLSEQQKIAEILSTVDESIEKTNAIIEETHELKKGLMQKLFTEGIGHTRFKETKIGRIPEEWEMLILNEAKKEIIDYRGKTPPKSDKGIFLVRTSNIRDGKIKFNEMHYVAENTYSNWFKKGNPTNQHVLITTEAPLGEVAVFPKQDFFSIGQRIVALNFDVNFINHIYFKYYCMSSLFQNLLTRRSVGTTVQGILSKELLKIPIAYPSIDEQCQIAQILSEVDAKIEKEEVTKAELEQLKKGLMQVLLTGKVRVKA